MRKICSLMAAAMVLVSALSRSIAGVEISNQDFYDALSPYGEWHSVEGYGYCWQPNVDNNWRPYTEGAWIYTEAGWTWASDEEWGWATDHYGRWMLTRDYGWLWVPGYEWGPAWVSWRTGEDYVGWAPLPPEATWQPATGFGPAVEVSFHIGPEYYSFCPVRYFGASRLRPYIVPRRENVTIVNNTVNVTKITNINNVTIFNEGPDFDEIRRRTEQPIRRARLERREDVSPEVVRAGEVRNQIEGDVLRVVAPRVERSNREARPPRLAGSIRRDQLVERAGLEQEQPPPPQGSRSEEYNIPPEPQRSEEQSDSDRRLSGETRRDKPEAQRPLDGNRRLPALDESRGVESAPDRNKVRETARRQPGAQPEEGNQTPSPSVSQPPDADQQSPSSRNPSRDERPRRESQAGRPTSQDEMRSDRQEGDMQREQQRRTRRSEESIQRPSSPAPEPSESSINKSAPERDRRDDRDRQNAEQRRRQGGQEAQPKQTEPSTMPPKERMQQRPTELENRQESASSTESRQPDSRPQSQGGERKTQNEISGRSRSQEQQPQVEGQQREKKESSKGKRKKKEEGDE